jgi:signal transduction histidine kinase
LEVVRAALSRFEGRGADRIQIVDTSNVNLLADRELMTLAIRQVLDNALKYSDADSTITCMTEAQPDVLILRVADRGPGIPESERERIFDKFHRSAGTQVPGTGLGLHIAREITRMHGGELWVEAGSPHGAVFCFRLPLTGGDSA